MVKSFKYVRYLSHDEEAARLSGVESLKSLFETVSPGAANIYAAYYDRCKRPDLPAMRDSNPTVILIPGLGMVARGKTKSESRVTPEFYNCAIEVMRGAEGAAHGKGQKSEVISESERG